MKDNVLIIHHNDADGRCAAAIVYNCEKNYDSAVKFAELDYASHKNGVLDKYIDDVIRAYDTAEHVSRVWIVDFSLPEAAMARLESVVKVIWIDHHKSACKYNYHHLEGLRNFTEKGPSGCELAWEYCYTRPCNAFKGKVTAIERGVYGKDITPTVVMLIGDYDSWRMKAPEECKPLITAMDALAWPPDSPKWANLLGVGDLKSEEYIEEQVDSIIASGRGMMIYRNSYAEGVAKDYGFETVLEGRKCYVMNLYRMGSLAFGRRMKEYDACIAFIYDGALYTVSMYSEKPEVDCSVICAKFGGGGHKGAAGFTCIELPFRRKY